MGGYCKVFSWQTRCSFVAEIQIIGTQKGLALYLCEPWKNIISDWCNQSNNFFDFRCLLFYFIKNSARIVVIEMKLSCVIYQGNLLSAPFSLKSIRKACWTRIKKFSPISCIDLTNGETTISRYACLWFQVLKLTDRFLSSYRTSAFLILPIFWHRTQHSPTYNLCFNFM